jgi:hypothetical protein
MNTATQRILKRIRQRFRETIRNNPTSGFPHKRLRK